MTAGLDEFQQLFRTFVRSAFRWECQPEYREPDEQEPLRRFLAGEVPDDRWREGFLEMLRDITAAGKSFARVLVLEDPPNDYQRFVMDLAERGNIPAGEQVHVMWREQAVALELPTRDFWIFDDQTVAEMHFGDGGLAGVDIITGDAAAPYRRWAHTAWEHSLPFSAYTAAIR